MVYKSRKKHNRPHSKYNSKKMKGGMFNKLFQRTKKKHPIYLL